MTEHTQVTARLPADLVTEIDRAASQDYRTRTDQLEYLARIGLAGRQRMKEPEQLAVAGIAKANRPDPDGSRQAAAEHLREHARLSGFAPTHEEE
jgi:metal-responsive CopG/Arc/MetJ family transcriptional regulator